ncbi:hypothetical protein Xaut_4855 (plasmid) [Xanthobacter versatilis]|uniref:DUF559 domain-containing protein n=1 Tax=Xanthobacter autotrophicus (strain ATCC BAA-1158 / Py2) TaxID=78245 RepID=A7IPX0_XANP2|nr:hypothetical protein Xaut_4855 [Xanthobacter autotrophicus Py2]
MLGAGTHAQGRVSPNARVPVHARRSHEIDLFRDQAPPTIEIDDREHETARRKRLDEDEQRDLEVAGYRIKCFANHSGIHDPVAVWRDIADMLSRRIMRTGA